jgi:polysaccharide export outer membrane protein
MREGWARRSRSAAILAACCLLSCALAFAQTAPPAQPPAPPAAVRAAYVLGPDDQLSVRVPDVDEISDKPLTVDLEGYVKLPMIGRVHAAGLSPAQLEQEIASRLKQFLQKPDVTVTVLEYRNQQVAATVSVLGSVKTAGVRPLLGRKILIEVIADAGGVADDAGYTMRIVRRLDVGRIPLPAAKDDDAGRFSSVEVSLKQVLDATDPAANLVILPQDVITVPRGRMVYVVGQVRSSGGYVLRERDSLSVLQAYTLAGGTDRGAAPNRARILRAVPNGGSRIDIPVDITLILKAKAPDVALLPDDVLVIPGSGWKKVGLRAAEIAASTAGLLIYRLP